ncbi:hypothetical protein XENOCAPTIV_016616, partial [Xenoophorus captivus]
LRNRSNANQANMIQSSPRTRVNRYIGRLIEARQTESDTADLNFITLISIVIIDVDSGENRTMAELPCDGARYAFLSCVVGTLTLALFLRVSWLPKMALMLLLGVTEEVYRMLNTNYDLVCRGKVSVKGKGEMLTYFLEGKVQGIGTATTSSVMRSTSLARRIHSCGKASVPTHLDSVSSAASLAPQAGMGGNFQMDTANISNNQATCLLSPCVPALGELEGEDDVEVTKIQIEAVPAIADVAM